MRSATIIDSSRRAVTMGPSKYRLVVAPTLRGKDYPRTGSEPTVKQTDSVLLTEINVLAVFAVWHRYCCFQ